MSGYLSSYAPPDIVIVTSEKVIMMELTVPSNTSESLRQAYAWKIAKENYQMLQTDLEDSFTTVEVGALGHSNNNSMQSSVSSLRVACPLAAKQAIKPLLDDAAKVAIATSYFIFLAINEYSWNSSRPLHL